MKEWEEITKYLPEDWEGKAKELGALIRRREIKTPEDLLSLILLYASEGGSLQATSTLMKLTAEIKLNKNAVYHRIKASWPWLQYMARGVCQRQGMTIPKPDFLGNRNVSLVDASVMSAPGSKSSDYRLHYMFDLFAFQCRSMEITDIKEGETITRYDMGKDDIVIADRGYGTITGMEHVLAKGGGYVFRLRSKAFMLYDGSGEKINLIPILRCLDSLEHTSIDCFYRLSNGCMRPLRIVVMKKDDQSIEQSKRKMCRDAVRKQQSFSEDTVELNQYIVLATNLDYTDDQILTLYRARWQIEQVFYRLKSLFGLGQLPCKNEDSAKAWFYAKLLIAAICEATVRLDCFSP
jgi:hypothetical protein